MLVVLGILFALYIVIKFGNQKSNAELKAKNDAFWQREQQANATRKVDISELDYLHIPYEELPLMDTQEENLLRIQNILKSLKDKSILNLTGFSNTDLKLLYGTANITFLSTCDNNYTTLIKTLYEWGNELYNQDYMEQSRQVLEYGVSLKTDIPRHYLLLGQIYKSTKDYDKIDSLIQTVLELNSTTKEPVLSALKQLKMSYYVD